MIRARQHLNPAVCVFIAMVALTECFSIAWALRNGSLNDFALLRALAIGIVLAELSTGTSGIKSLCVGLGLLNGSIAIAVGLVVANPAWFVLGIGCLIATMLLD